MRILILALGFFSFAGSTEQTAVKQNQFTQTFTTQALVEKQSKKPIENAIKIKRLSPSVYQFTSYKVVEPWGRVGGHGLIVTKGSDAYLVNTPWTVSATQKLLSWAKSKGLTLKGAIATHYHEDASGGIAKLNSLGVPTFATQTTNELLAQNGKAQATHILISEQPYLFDGMAEFYFAGKGHTADNIVVSIAQDNVLFGGCLVRSVNSKSLGNIEDAHLADWPETMEKVINKFPDAKIIVPGHGRIGGFNLLQHTQALAISANE